MLDFNADKAVFLSDFAETVVYTPFGGQAANLPTIFDNANQDIRFDMGVLGSGGPRVIVSDSDVPNLSKKDTFTVRSVVYKVADIQPDGTGFTTVLLKL